MIKEIFPEGDIIFKDKPYSTEFFNQAVDEIDRAGESFIGVIKVDDPDISYFLFFLRGDAYAAGYITSGRPMPLSIKDFLQQVSTASAQQSISCFKTDPVLLKGMLVFLQREPSIKATTDMINLDGILSQIKNEKSSAFVILKKNDMYNFFYFHSGEPKLAHFADKPATPEGMTLAEKLLFYAYPADKTPVVALIYSDIKTSGASDISDIKQFLIADAMQVERKGIGKAEAALPPSKDKVGIDPQREEKPARVRIAVTDGPHKGNKFNVPLPCTIGRRDADIRIRDMTVSKKHASLEVSGKQIIFKDLGSTNGSIVNGKEVKETVLSDGDTIQIGNTTLTINFV